MGYDAIFDEHARWAEGPDDVRELLLRDSAAAGDELRAHVDHILEMRGLTDPLPGYVSRVNANAQSKTCPACGRPFTNRKKWSSRGQWDQVVYCSKRCQGAAKAK